MSKNNHFFDMFLKYVDSIDMIGFYGFPSVAFLSPIALAIDQIEIPGMLR